MNRFALTTAELEHLAARGLLGWQNPTLPGLAPPPMNQRRVYKRITPAQAMARRRAEERGEDTSRWPARVRPSWVRKRELRAERRRVAVRDSLRRFRGKPEGVELFLRGELL